MSLIDTLLKVALLGAEWVLWLLLILSVTSLTIGVERWWFFARNQRRSGELREELERALQERVPVDDVLARHTCLEAKVLRVAWNARAGGPAAVGDALEGELAVARRRMESGLTFLGIVGSNAPFIGLVGTVIGVIEAFHALGAGGNADMGLVMALIAEALVATGVGIAVAIPAVIAFNNGQARVGAIEGEATALGKVLAAALRMQVAADSAIAGRG